MKVTFYGVRGSVPAPGPETVRYGGNTACVALRAGDGQLAILDAGTGIIQLGRELMAGEFGKGQGSAALVVSHAHWDHIQGFPFFAPIFVPGNRFLIHGPGGSSAMLEQILEGQMNPHFSPLYTMKNLGASIELSPVSVDGDTEFVVAGIRARGHVNPHGSTVSVAYRFEEGDRSLVYASDAGYPTSGVDEAAIDFYRGADLLIHDCTYSPEDRARRLARGFSSIAEAAECAVRAGVRRLAMFHYDQDYADEMVDALADRCRRLLDERGGEAIELIAAREGLTLDA